MSGGISTERCRPSPATQSPMESIERRVAGEVKAMTRKEVIVKTIAGELTWIQAADIPGDHGPTPAAVEAALGAPRV